MDNVVDLQKVVFRLCQRQGLNKEQVAAALEIDPRNLSKYFLGDQRFRPEKLAKLHAVVKPLEPMDLHIFTDLSKDVLLNPETNHLVRYRKLDLKAMLQINCAYLIGVLESFGFSKSEDFDKQYTNLALQILWQQFLGYERLAIGRLLKEFYDDHDAFEIEKGIWEKVVAMQRERGDFRNEESSNVLFGIS